MTLEPTFELIKVEYDTEIHFWRGTFLNRMTGLKTIELGVSIQDTKTSREVHDNTPELSHEEATQRLRKEMRKALQKLLELSEGW